MEMMYEEIVTFGRGVSLTGIFTPAKVNEPNSKPCTILLNAGLIHKIGPNRLYKKLAGLYSENGFNAFRFDFSGMGDSEYSNKKVSSDEAYFDEISMAMRWIQENKGVDKFLLSGICSGARLAFLVSLEDSRVVGLSLIDGVYADENLMKKIGRQAEQNTTIRYYKKNMFSLSRWMKLLSGKSKFFKLKNISTKIKQVGSLVILKIVTVKKLKNNGDSSQVPLSNVLYAKPWEMLVDRGVKVQLIFCEGGSAIDIYNLSLAKQLSKYKESGELQTILVKDADHTFTPIWSQNHLLELTTSWLKKEFKKNLAPERAHSTSNS
jgi:hypothetical protein